MMIVVPNVAEMVQRMLAGVETSPATVRAVSFDQATTEAVARCPHRSKPKGCCGPVTCLGGKRPGEVVSFEICAWCVEGADEP